MKKQSAQRKHNFPDADLYLVCIDSIRNALEDLKEFKTYGYDAQRLKTFKTRCDKFRDLPDDDELVGEQMVLTDKKYAYAEELKASIRSLMTRVSMKFGNRSGRYRKFGANKLGDMTDAQLIFCGRRCVRVARGMVDFLDDVGVNEDVIGKITTSAQNFEAAVNRKLDKVSERDIGVERRIIRGNDLYDELVTLCKIGKDIWREKDRTRYDKYCIYESNNDQKIERKEKAKKEKKGGLRKRT